MCKSTTDTSTMNCKCEESSVVTCVYCGMEYPEGTPTSKAELLTKHIKVCESHPMRGAERDIRILREALIGLIGVETKGGLTNMLNIITKLTDVSEEDKMVSINAINVLLETM